MKKEKYISVINKASGKILQIKIKTPQGYAYDYVNCKDYPTEAKAMKVATEKRDHMLVDKEILQAKKKLKPTVAELFEGKFASSGLTIKTQNLQRKVFKSALLTLGSIPIDKVTPAMVLKNVAEYADTHTQNMTDRLVSVWNQVFEYAIDCNIQVTNPTKKARKIKGRAIVEHRNVLIEEDDFKEFLKACMRSKSKLAHSVANYLVVIRYTGLQPAEAMALTVDSIGEGYIFINKIIGSTTTQTCQIVPPKNEHRYRYVPVHQGLQPILDRIKEEAIADKRKLLFVMADGTPYDTDKVSGLISRISKKAGLDFNTYQLRHNVATNLLDNGYDIVTIGEILGHRAQNTTVGYIRSTSKKKINAIDSLGLLN